MYILDENINCFYSNRYYAKCVRPVLSIIVITVGNQSIKVIMK